MFFFFDQHIIRNKILLRIEKIEKNLNPFFLNRRKKKKKTVEKPNKRKKIKTHEPQTGFI